MRFALLGDHPDGVDLAEALADSSRHQVVAVTAALPDERLHRLGRPRLTGDVEDVLADPAVEAVIVAGSPSVRLAQLRRALQSERPVLCVHPADEKADGAYEASLLQGDTGSVLFPILPEALHPGIARLGQFVSRGGVLDSPVGEFHLLAFERHSPGEVLDNAHQEGLTPAVPGWDVLRRLGGELSEVSAFAEGGEVAAGKVVLLAGRFQKGGLFQVTLVPHQPAARWRLVVTGSRGEAELLWPQGWNGPAFLTWREGGQTREEYWPRWDPWPAAVAEFERVAEENLGGMAWQDEVRALELDDAARRSAERQRVHLMEYQEASEEVGFKGTMTLVGCGMLWGVLLLLVVARWFPLAGWLILPLLVIFVGMQLFRFIIPARPAPADGGPPAPAGGAPARQPADDRTTAGKPPAG